MLAGPAKLAQNANSLTSRVDHQLLVNFCSHSPVIVTHVLKGVGGFVKKAARMSQVICQSVHPHENPSHKRLEFVFPVFMVDNLVEKITVVYIVLTAGSVSTHGGWGRAAGREK